MTDTITLTGARLHNLKNITVSIPKNRLVALTGLSGSGKSTLAFDILHKESSRQYMMSLGMVTYAMSKPDYDSLVGLSPSISIDQNLSNRNPRSTVGTVTEVYTYLRVLFARLGQRPCPSCGAPLELVHDMVIEDEWLADDSAGFDETFPCPHCAAPVPQLGMAHFSFNKPAGACPTCTGLGMTMDANLATLLDDRKSILEGGVPHWDKYEIARYAKSLALAGEHYGFGFDPAAPVGELDPAQRDLFLYGVHHPKFTRHYPQVAPPESAFAGRFEGLVTNLLRRYQEHADNPEYRARLDRYLVRGQCPDCQGARLRHESRQVTIDGLNIVAVAHMPFHQLLAWLGRLPDELTPEGKQIAEPVMTDLLDRVQRLVEVGVGYLSMDRDAPSLSVGEAQRLRLAALLGSGLTGVLYVLDEPTIGLHPRDIGMLIGFLRRLRDLGNTVLMVEHDLEMIRSADYVIDIGPGAGRHGGEVVATGNPDQIAANPASITGKYLAGGAMSTNSIRASAQPRSPTGNWLSIEGACANNLRAIDVRIPVGLLTAVTGVSGSGKSSLVFDTLDLAARQRFDRAAKHPGPHDRISGWEYFDEVITIDQGQIGRNPRSNVATYTDTFSGIRAVFASTKEAQKAGVTARHFSFNVPGGRCERCEGSGALSINMHFLPDVPVRCPDCHGRRYKASVLNLYYRGVNISQALRMTVEEALEIFHDTPAIANRLSMMIDVGLGYLQLGQPATTFSGGEAQRIKLAKELGRRKKGRTLYLFDEPTTGLHPADIDRLLGVFERLVAGRNTLVVIEHNLDVIRAADWIIDLGPEGGSGGGRVVAQGSPAQIAAMKESYTGAFLRAVSP